MWIDYKKVFYTNYKDKLIRVEYEFEQIHYKLLLIVINNILPKSHQLIEDPFNDNKSAFCKYNDIAIELVQLDNLDMVLRISDYREFYN